MSTQYNQLLESNSNLGQNQNFEKINPNNTNYMNNPNLKMTGENNLIEDEMSHNNKNQNMISSEFYPYQRIPQIIKWRNIMKIDIDLIKTTKDLSLLNSNLENLIYSDITEDDIQSVPEQNVTKLIKILQFLNEFLFEQREIISNKLMILKEEGINLNKNKEDLGMNISKQEDYLNKQKQEAKQRMKNIVDYKNEINELIKNGKLNKGGGVRQMKFTDINYDINTQKNAYYMNNQKYNLRGPKEGYKCKYCTGKLFPSEFELNKHLNDVHLISVNKEEQKIRESYIKPQVSLPIEVNLPLNNFMNKNNNKNELLEKKLNDMKFEMQNYMHQAEMDTLKNQMMLQNNMNSNMDNYKQQVGNIFNDKLKECMEMVAKKVNEKPKINNNKVNTKELDEKIIALKKEIMKAEQGSKEYEIKIKDIKNQINIINIKRQKIEETKINIIPKITNLVSEKNEKLEYKILRANYPLKKFKDNAGRLESDNDDSEDEKKKRKKVINNLKEETDIFNIIVNKPSYKPEIINFPPKVEDNFFKSGKKPKIKFKEKNTENLDDFYKRYKNRDDDFIQKPKMKNYKQVLPDNFNDNYDVNKNLKNYLDDYLKKTAKIFYNENKSIIPPIIDEGDLEKYDMEELAKTAEKIIDDLKPLNQIKEKKGKKLDPQYTAITELIKLENIEENMNDIKFKKNEDDKHNLKSKKKNKNKKENSNSSDNEENDSDNAD